MSEMIGSETGPIPWERAKPMVEQLLDAVRRRMVPGRIVQRQVSILVLLARRVRVRRHQLRDDLRRRLEPGRIVQRQVPILVLLMLELAYNSRPRLQ